MNEAEYLVLVKAAQPLLDQIRLNICLCDRNGKIVYVNPHAAESIKALGAMLGYDEIKTGYDVVGTAMEHWHRLKDFTRNMHERAGQWGKWQIQGVRWRSRSDCVRNDAGEVIGYVGAWEELDAGPSPDDKTEATFQTPAYGRRGETGAVPTGKTTMPPSGNSPSAAETESGRGEPPVSVRTQVLDQLHHPLLLLDARRRITYVNQAMLNYVEKVTGRRWTREQVVNLDIVALHPEHARVRMKERIAAILAGQRLQPRFNTVAETMYLTYDTPLTNDRGEIVGLMMEKIPVNIVSEAVSRQSDE